MNKNENYFVDYRSKIIRIKNMSESKSKSKKKVTMSKSKSKIVTSSGSKSYLKLNATPSTKNNDIKMKKEKIHSKMNNSPMNVHVIRNLNNEMNDNYHIKNLKINSNLNNNNKNKIEAKKTDQYNLKSNMGKFICSNEENIFENKSNVQLKPENNFNNNIKNTSECHAILNKYGDLLRSSNLNIKIQNDKFVIKEEKNNMNIANLKDNKKSKISRNSSKKIISIGNKSSRSANKSVISKNNSNTPNKSDLYYNKVKDNHSINKNEKHSPNYSLITVNTNTINNTNTNNTDINEKQYINSGVNVDNKSIIQTKVYNINKHLGESSERSLIYSNFKDYNQDMKNSNSKSASKSKSVNQSKMKNAQVMNKSNPTNNSKSNTSILNHTDNSINFNNNHDSLSFVYDNNDKQNMNSNSIISNKSLKPQLFLQLIKTYIQKISSISNEIHLNVSNLTENENSNINPSKNVIKKSDVNKDLIKNEFFNLHETILKFGKIVNSDSVEKLLNCEENVKPKLIDENIIKKYQKDKNYDLIEKQIVEVTKENNLLKNDIQSLNKINNDNFKALKNCNKEKEELILIINNLQEKNSLLCNKLKNQEYLIKEIESLKNKNKILEIELNEKCQQLEYDINKSIKIDRNFDLNMNNIVFHDNNVYSEKEYNLNSKSSKSDYSKSIKQNILNLNNKNKDGGNYDNARNNYKVENHENQQYVNKECTGNNSIFNKTYKVKPGGNIKDFYLNFENKEKFVENSIGIGSTTRRNKSSDMSKDASTNRNKNTLLTDNFHIVNYNNNLNKSLTKSVKSVNSNSNHSDKSKEKLNQGNFKKNLEKVLHDNSSSNNYINNNSNKEKKYYEDNNTNNFIATNLENEKINKNKNVLYSFGNTLINTARNSPEPIIVNVNNFNKEENSLLKSIAFKEEMDNLDNEIKNLHSKLEYISKD